MEFHIVESARRAPRLLTIATEARALARELNGVTAPLKLGNKAETMERLNGLFENAFAAGRRSAATSLADYSAKAVEQNGGFPAIRPDALPSEAFGRDMSATAVIARSDNPGTDIDAIVETILAAKGCALKRFAGAVAVAFTKLGGQG